MAIVTNAARSVTITSKKTMNKFDCRNCEYCEDDWCSWWERLIEEVDECVVLEMND